MLVSLLVSLFLLRQNRHFNKFWRALTRDKCEQFHITDFDGGLPIFLLMLGCDQGPVKPRLIHRYSWHRSRKTRQKELFVFNVFIKCMILFILLLCWIVKFEQDHFLILFILRLEKTSCMLNASVEHTVWCAHYSHYCRFKYGFFGEVRC